MLRKMLRKWTPLRGRRPIRAGRAAPRGWTLQRLEDRTVPTVGFAVGSGLGNSGAGFNQVNVYNTAGVLVNSFDAFPGYNVGARVAVGDLTGDGNPDVVVGVGSGGGPQVNVYDGAFLETGANPNTVPGGILKQFFAYAPNFTGGVNVAVGDIDGQVDPVFGAQNEIVTGAGNGGGPHVRVFNFATLAVPYEFFAYDFPGYSGGVTVAAGNVGGDTGNPSHPDHFSDEVVTGTGPGGGPHVKVWSVNVDVISLPLEQVGQFYAYDPTFLGGVNVGSGFVTNNRDDQDNLYADILTSPGSTFGPVQVGNTTKVWRLESGDNTDDSLFHFYAAATFNPYSPGLNIGVVVATIGDLNGDGFIDFITGAGQGGGPHIAVWGGTTLNDVPPNPPQPTYLPPPVTLTGTGESAFYAFDSTYNGGTYVG